MYESFYNLQQNPFSNQPEIDSIYFGDKHKAALAALKYSLVDPVGFTVLTGPAGTGKTTLLQYVRSTVNADYAEGIDFTIGFVSNTSDFGGQLSQGLLATYGLDASGKSESESYKMLRNHLIKECYKKNRQPYLVIDQAESINTQAMEELGELTNISTYRGKRLQFILVGREQLMTVLRLPCSEPIARQIGQLFALNPLDLNETAEYIQHRLDVVGADGNTLFDAAACKIVYELSKGIPRTINKLCNVALEQGYQNQQSVLDKAFIDQVLRDAHRLKAVDELDRDLKSLDVPDVDEQAETNCGGTEIAQELSVQSTELETDTFEWRISNPWDDRMERIKVFELRHGIDKDFQSVGDIDNGAKLESQSVFLENPVARVLKLNKRGVYGLLTLAVGALFGILVAVYLSNIRSDSTSSELSPATASQESVVVRAVTEAQTLDKTKRPDDSRSN